MYKKLSIGVATFLVVLFVPGLVLAHEDEPVEDEATTQTVEMTAEDRLEERKSRIEEYKTKITERLNASEEKKIAGVCKTSQTKLEKVHTEVESTLAKRQEKLNSMTQHLKDLELKLKEASIDTTNLNAVIAELETKTTDILVGFEEYQQMLEDSSSIDCETEPQGFKASIEAARAKRAEIKTMSEEIKSYVKDSVKTLLDQIKASLEQPAAESEI